MTSTPELNGALEAVDRILNRGGDADEVLRAVLDVLHERAGYERAAIWFVEEGQLVEGPFVGEAAGATRTPVSYEGTKVGELELGGGPPDDAFAERVATLISAYVLVGWDTGGEAWEP